MATPVLRAPFTYLVLGTPPEPTNGAQMPNAFRDVASYYGAQLAGVSPGEFVMGGLYRPMAHASAAAAAAPATALCDAPRGRPPRGSRGAC